MPKRVPDWIEGFLFYTQGSEPPLLYRKWAAISTLAACMKRKCWLSWGTITFFPNLYVVLVGPSGRCRKGTAMGPAYDMLSTIGIKMAADTGTKEALAESLEDAMEVDADDEGRAIPHCSLTIFSPELTVFLGYSNLELMSYLVDWYDCKDRWKYKTKNKGTNDITNVWVNLFGATTPELIQSAMPRDAIGGGLTSRIIFVYEQKKGRSSPLPFLTHAEITMKQDLLIDLESICMLRGEFKLDNTFTDQWIRWYCWQEDHPPFESQHLQGYISRRPTHVLKLSMIMNASRGGDMLLTSQDLSRAIDAIEEVEFKMPKVFAGLGSSRTADVYSRVLNEIGIQMETSLSHLMRVFQTDVESKRQMLEILSAMETARIIQIGEAKGDLKIIYKGKELIHEQSNRFANLRRSQRLTEEPSGGSDSSGSDSEEST